MAEFVAKCPYCNTALILQDEWVGMKAQCFQCKNKFVVVKPNEKTENSKVCGAVELPTPDNEESDTFSFVCSQCGTMATLPASLNGKIYECSACCEKSIAEPAYERKCPLCNGVIKFNATVCKHCKHVISLSKSGGQPNCPPLRPEVVSNAQNIYHSVTPLPVSDNGVQVANSGTHITIVQQNSRSPEYVSPGFNSFASVGQKSRTVYIVLGILLGHLGIHDFYARYTTNGLIKLLATLLVGWLLIPLFVVWVWAIIDICTVSEDADGIPFV